jgi:hypothetical protein
VKLTKIRTELLQHNSVRGYDFLADLDSQAGPDGTATVPSAGSIWIGSVSIAHRFDDGHVLEGGVAHSQSAGSTLVVIRYRTQALSLDGTPGIHDG